MQAPTFCMVWRLLCNGNKCFSFSGKCQIRTDKLLSKRELRDARGNQEPFKTTGSDQENSSLSPVRPQALHDLVGNKQWGWVWWTDPRRCGRNLCQCWLHSGAIWGWDGWDEQLVTDVQWNIQRDTVHACSELALLSCFSLCSLS